MTVVRLVYTDYAAEPSSRKAQQRYEKIDSKVCERKTLRIISYHIISYQKFIERPLLREPRP